MFKILHTHIHMHAHTRLYIATWQDSGFNLSLSWLQSLGEVEVWGDCVHLCTSHFQLLPGILPAMELWRPRRFRSTEESIVPGLSNLAALAFNFLPGVCSPHISSASLPPVPSEWFLIGVQTKVAAVWSLPSANPGSEPFWPKGFHYGLL